MDILPLVFLTSFHYRLMSKRHSNLSFGEVGYVTFSAKVISHPTLNQNSSMIKFIVYMTWTMCYVYLHNYLMSQIIKIKRYGSIRGPSSFPHLPIIARGPMPMCWLRFHRTTDKSNIRQPTTSVRRSHGLSPTKERSTPRRI